MGGAGESWGGGFPPFKVVGELVEIKVATARLNFAALEIHVVGAHGRLGGIERGVVVGVGGHAVVVEAAEVEVADFAFLGLRQRPGVAHRPIAHVRVDRQPTPGRQVNFGPIVVGGVAGQEVPAGLPAGRDAVQAAQGDEQQRLLAAIAVALGAAVVADVREGGILAGVAVEEVVGRPLVEQAGAAEGVGFAAENAGRKLAQGGREHHVRSFREEGAEGGIGGVHGQGAGGVEIEANTAGREVVIHPEFRGHGAAGRGFKIDRTTGLIFRPDGARRGRGGQQMKISLVRIAAGDGHPHAQILPGRDGVGFDRDGHRDLETVGQDVGRTGGAGGGADFARLLQLEPFAEGRIRRLEPARVEFGVAEEQVADT